MSEIVRIIALLAFDYSHDNGITLLNYQPGQIYEIPDSAIEGLRRRNAIEILDRQAVDTELSLMDPFEDIRHLEGEGEQSGSDEGDGHDSEHPGVVLGALTPVSPVEPLPTHIDPAIPVEPLAAPAVVVVEKVEPSKPSKTSKPDAAK